MSNFVHKLISVMFQNKQTQQIIRMQPQPLPTSLDEWHDYWKAQGQPWRYRPEIDTERQEELKRCLAREPDTEKGTYPFKEVKLSRDDVEWLLWAHESSDRCGLVNWNYGRQRERAVLDLRGAYLEGEILSDLPLAPIRAGLSLADWYFYDEEQKAMAAVHLQKAILERANLQRAYLSGADLQEAYLSGANLQGAGLQNAYLQKARLKEANLQGADLHGADLKGAFLFGADLQGANLREAQLKGADLKDVTLVQFQER